MKLAHAFVVIVFATTHAFAKDQTGNPATPAKVEAQKIVRSIVGDKSKIKAYCDLAKLYEQMADAEAKKDAKSAGTLNQMAQAQLDKLGPDYAKLLDAFDQTGPDTADGRAISASLDALDRQCK